MPRYHVTVESPDLGRAPEAAVRDAGAEMVRKAKAPPGAVTALATDEQIETLTAAGCAVHRHEDVAEGAAERLAEVGEGDRYGDALRRLAGQ